MKPPEGLTRGLRSPEREAVRPGVEASVSSRGRSFAPPPPPTYADGSQSLAEEWNRVKRQRRELRRQTWQQKVRAVNPSYWKALACVAAIAVGALWWRSYAQDQRDTDLAIAALATRGLTATSQPAPVEPFPNPLLELGLSNQATWLVGLDPTTGELLQARSAFVVAELLKTVDLCSTYVGIDAQGVLFVALEPLPGSVPLVQGCAATTTTTAGA